MSRSTINFKNELIYLYYLGSINILAKPLGHLDCVHRLMISVCMIALTDFHQAHASIYMSLS